MEEETVVGEGLEGLDAMLADSGGKWFKLKSEGDTALVNFFDVAGGKVVEVDNFNKDGKVKRFRVRVWVQEQGLLTWDLNMNTARDFKRQVSRRGIETIEKSWYLVERTGTGTSTRYPLDLERELSDDEIAERNAKAGGSEDLPF